MMDRILTGYVIWDNIPKHGDKGGSGFIGGSHIAAPSAGEASLEERHSVSDVFRYREAGLRGRGHGGVRHPGKKAVEVPGLHHHRTLAERGAARETTAATR